MNKSNLTTISLLLKVATSDIAELSDTAQNELEAVYESSAENSKAAEELKRKYLVHRVEKLIADLAECYRFDEDMLHELPKDVKVELFSVWQKSHDIIPLYDVVQRYIQVSDIQRVSDFLEISADSLEEKYSSETIGQICGAFNMLNGIESKAYIKKEIQSIMEGK